jgi:hypothetical protein
LAVGFTTVAAPSQAQPQQAGASSTSGQVSQADVFPGKFLQEVTPGAAYSYPYVMVTYVFLAEK